MEAETEPHLIIDHVVVKQEASAVTPSQKFEGHSANLVFGVIHLPGGERMMTCSTDGSLRV
jgi:hypothetical protein